MTNSLTPQQLGSQTAINGFRNEDDIILKFNNWQNDLDAQKWLLIMGYEINEIRNVIAVKISGEKTDVQAQITIHTINRIDAQNMQVKLVSNTSGFNQIDKRWIDKYIQLWNMPDNISNILKRYTGEITPNILYPSDSRRMFANEFTLNEQGSILNWLNENKIQIITDILKGRGRFAAEWMLVAQTINNNTRWILKSMNFCLNYFGNGNIEITDRGNFRIGRITMQRKGGDNGRETAKMLQFKIDPSQLFDS